MIEFQEDDDRSYRGRTYKNASADVTIAIAQDFTTAGEVLTKKYVLEQGKLFIPISVDVFTDKSIYSKVIRSTVSLIDDLGKDEIILNIAGNGIYTLNLGFINKQSMADYLVYCLLNEIQSKLKTKIIKIRTGGQSGMDEAGAKAGIKLSIPTLVLSPKNWLYRDINNNDISNEEAFKNRFK